MLGYLSIPTTLTGRVILTFVAVLTPGVGFKKKAVCGVILVSYLVFCPLRDRLVCGNDILLYNKITIVIWVGMLYSWEYYSNLI